MNKIYLINQLSPNAHIKASSMVNRMINSYANCGLEVDIVQFEISTRKLKFNKKGKILEFQAHPTGGRQ